MIRVYLSLILFCFAMQTQAQETVVDSTAVQTVSDSTIRDTFRMFEIPPGYLDCAHGHICCQVACPCCPEGEAFYDLLRPEVIPENKKRKK